MPAPLGERRAESYKLVEGSEGSTASWDELLAVQSQLPYESPDSDLVNDDCSADRVELENRLRCVHAELAQARAQHEASQRQIAEMVNQLRVELARHEEQSGLVRAECKGLVKDIELARQMSKSTQDQVTAVMQECQDLRSRLAQVSAANATREAAHAEATAARAAATRLEELRLQEEVAAGAAKLASLERSRRGALAEEAQLLTASEDAGSESLAESRAEIANADSVAQKRADERREELLTLHEQYAVAERQLTEVLEERDKLEKDREPCETKVKTLEAKVKTLEKKRSEVRSKAEQLERKLAQLQEQCEASRAEQATSEDKLAAARSVQNSNLQKLRLLWGAAAVASAALSAALSTGSL